MLGSLRQMAAMRSVSTRTDRSMAGKRRCENPLCHDRGGAVLQDGRAGRRLRQPAAGTGQARPRAGRHHARVSAGAQLRPADRADRHPVRSADRPQNGGRHVPAEHAAGRQGARVPRPPAAVLRPARALSRERPRLQGQLRAVRVLLPGRAGSDPAARPAAPSSSTATIGRPASSPRI